MLSVIDPGEDVRFFYYDLFSRQTLDEFLSENTEKDLCDFLYEYGYVSANCYTDQWGFTDPGAAYVLAIYGVDMNGDTFLQQEAIEPEPYEPEIELTLTPYENEAESLYGYNTLHVSATGFPSRMPSSTASSSPTPCPCRRSGAHRSPHSSSSRAYSRRTPSPSAHSSPRPNTASW